MSKVKLSLASMLLVFALGAIAAASASAEETPEFRIEGLEKGVNVEFAETVEVSSPLLLAAEGENEKKEKEKEPTIECSKMRIEKGSIKNDSPEITIKSFHFEGCVDTSEKTCELPKIETVELKDTLQADGETMTKEKETDEKFEPKSGKVIAEFKLKGSLCKEKEKTLRIEGDFVSKKEDNFKSEDAHNLGIEVTPASGELKYGDQTYGGLWRDDFHWRPRIQTLNWFLF